MYAPLKFIVDPADKPSGWEIAKKYVGKRWETGTLPLLKKEFDINDISEQWFRRYLLGPDFLKIDPDECEKIKQLDPIALQSFKKWNLTKYLSYKIVTSGFVPYVISMYGYDINNLPPEFDVVSEIKDFFMIHLIVDDWIKTKQVYKPEQTFTKYLLNTEKLVITMDMFRHLPFKTFYIDVEDCNQDDQFGTNLSGFFINIEEIKSNHVALTFMSLAKDEVLTSSYNLIKLDDEFTLDFDAFAEQQQLTVIPDATERLGVTGNIIRARNAMKLTLQIIGYLNSKAPDLESVTEPPVIKPKRKKGKAIITTPLNFGLTKTEIGVKLGTKIRTNIEAMEQAQKKQAAEYAANPEKFRKPPAPHYRSAHWHKYWCGSEKDNSQHLELRWIEPVFVCGNYTSESKADVTIHPVE